jgi:pSer/pThr/pTyr-binding forkhead associated (FHA) protein
MTAQRLSHAERLALFERQQQSRRRKQFGIAPASRTEILAAAPSPSGQADAKSPATSRISTSRVPKQPPPDSAVRLRLRAVSGPDAGAEFALRDGEYVIGRGDDADLRLMDDTVSHHHAKIVVTSRRTTIEDLHSTNGSKLGDVDLRGIAIVSPGDQVFLGEVELLAEEGDQND